MPLELLTNETFEVWDTDLPDVWDADPDVTYTVRAVSPAERRAIEKRHTDFQPAGGGAQTTDFVAVLDDVIDLCVVGWTGILLRGEPAPCTRELKIAGLDFQRKQALRVVATSNRRARGRAESFREPARVRDVVG